MRSSYTTFIQPYLGLVILSGLLFLEFNISGLSFLFFIKSIGSCVALGLTFFIKFIRRQGEEFKVYNVFGRSKIIMKADIVNYGRAYFQICWIELKNGKRIFFMQRTYDTLEDIISNKKLSRLDALFNDENE